MEMEKLLSRMKFSNGSGNTWLWESSIIKSLFFSFFFPIVQELTNCQGFFVPGLLSYVFLLPLPPLPSKNSPLSFAFYPTISKVS